MPFARGSPGNANRCVKRHGVESLYSVSDVDGKYRHVVYTVLEK